MSALAENSYLSEPLLKKWKQQRALRVNAVLARYGMMFSVLASLIDIYFAMPPLVLAGDVGLLFGTLLTLLYSRKVKLTAFQLSWGWLPLYVGLWLANTTSLAVTGGMSSPFFGGYLTLMYVAGLVMQVRIRPLYITTFIFLNLFFWMLSDFFLLNPFLNSPPPLVFTFLINTVVICTLMVCVHEFLRTEKGLAEEVFKYYQNLTAVQKNLSREEASNATKTTFLAHISHELRTPLGAILGYADLVLDEKSSEVESKEFVETIRHNGQQLLHLVDDLLDLTKVEAGKIEIEKVNFNPIESINEVIELLILSAHKKGLRLSFVIENQPPVHFASDPLRFRQILMNVLGNAIKFCDRGHIQVTLKYLNQTPENTPFLILEIQDTGRGLSLEEQTRLFKPFQQADASISRKYGGSGLGLNLSRRLAHLLDGELSLAWSKPGIGSCFCLKLPAPAMEKKTNFQTIHQTRVQPKHFSEIPRGKKILIVEDNIDNQKLISRYLVAAGVSIEMANDGLEAIQKATHDHFDLVLMDVQMPVLDGLQAVQILRKKAFSKPIIALTAHAMKEDRDRCLNAGFNDYLTKPIDRGLLLSKIKSHLSSSVSEAFIEA